MIWKKIILQNVSSQSRPSSLRETSQHDLRSVTSRAPSSFGYEPSFRSSAALYDISLHQETLDASFEFSERQLLRELLQYARHAFRMYEAARPSADQVYVLKLAYM